VDDSICSNHLIKSGDYIIMSSDGLFDNLYEDEIAMLINKHHQDFYSHSVQVNLSNESSNPSSTSSSNQSSNESFNPSSNPSSKPSSNESSNPSSTSSSSSSLLSLDKEIDSTTSKLNSATINDSSFNTNNTNNNNNNNNDSLGLVSEEFLNSTCQLLVAKASNAGIKRDDMLIMLTYIV
jgi:hypothetical protein